MLGPPTVELSLSEPFTIDAGTSETIRYFVLPTDLEADRWITGVDVIPGSRAIVRHVAVYVDTTGQARVADQTDDGPGFTTGFQGDQPIGVWWPGQNPVKLDGVGYPLPPGADIVTRVLYKKTWITEGQAFTDQTRVGLHLTEAGVNTIEHSVLRSPEEPSGQNLVFSHTLDQDIDLLGLLPEVEIETVELQIEGVLPDGSRQPLLLILDPDPDWPTRYWFDRSRSLPSGSQIEVSATLRPGAERVMVSSLFAADTPVRLLLDYTLGTSAEN